MGVNSLPKTVTRQRHGCDLNPSPYAPESSTLTTRLPSHPGYLQNERHWNFVPNSGLRRFRRQLGHIAWSHCKTRRRSNWPVTTIDASWLDAHVVYYTSIDRNAVTPLLLLLVDLFCKLLCSCKYKRWRYFDWHIIYSVARAVRLLLQMSFLSAFFLLHRTHRQLVVITHRLRNTNGLFNVLA